LCSVDHPDYQAKRDLMEPLLTFEGDLLFDSLPPLLAYHLMFLHVLSSCTVGRLNITTVEAKVQSVFSYIHIIQSILDPGTILFAKLVFARFLFNAVIEVELAIPGLEMSAVLWKLLDSFGDVLIKGKEELLRVQSLGWDNPSICRQRIEYMMYAIMIISGFFGRYYDPSNFDASDIGSSSRSSTTMADRTRIRKPQVNKLIVDLFNKIIYISARLASVEQRHEAHNYFGNSTHSKKAW